MKRYLLNYFPYFFEIGVKKTESRSTWQWGGRTKENTSIDDGYMKWRFVSLRGCRCPIVCHESPWQDRENEALHQRLIVKKKETYIYAYEAYKHKSNKDAYANTLWYPTEQKKRLPPSTQEWVIAHSWYNLFLSNFKFLCWMNNALICSIFENNDKPRKISHSSFCFLW